MAALTALSACLPGQPICLVGLLALFVPATNTIFVEVDFLQTKML